MARWIFGLLTVLLVGCSAPQLRLEPASTASPEAKSPIASETVQSEIKPEILSDDERTNQSEEQPLVKIPAGKFLMGAPADAGLAVCEISRPGCKLEDFEDEAPEHEVFLPDFWISLTEVTNSQYRKCVDAGGCNPPQFQDFFATDEFADHPVVYVRWTDAAAYCQWADGRLPTEAEWEKAARGTDGRQFPWGFQTNLCGFANFKGCTRGLTTEVGQFPDGASPYGVLDMAGNAAEWVSDWYDPEYYSQSPFEAPGGPEEGEMKVARGGSWKNPSAGVRVTNRSANFPDVSSSGVGFRCVFESRAP